MRSEILLLSYRVIHNNPGELDEAGQCVREVALRQAIKASFNSATDSQILALNHKHNATRPFYRLPSDIIHDILFIVVSEHGKPQTFPKAAITLSHVCSLWRFVTLSTPLLCNNLYGQLTRNAAQELVGRCKTAPLELYSHAEMPRFHFRSRTPGQKLHSGYALDHLGLFVLRLKTIWLSVAWQGASMLLSCLLQPAPQLETLELGLTGLPTQQFALVNLPVDLLGGQDVHLRVLSLRALYPSVKAPIYNSLTTVELGNYPPHLCPSLNQLFLLARCQRLEELGINRLAPGATPWSP